MPRWRTFIHTASTSELDSVRSGRDVSEREVAEMDRALTSWKHRPGISTAADVAGTALVLRQSDRGREAAEFILAHRDKALPTEMALARDLILDEGASADAAGPDATDADTDYERSAVHRRKLSLQLDLSNAVGWSELARSYAVLGQLDKSRRAMMFALSLAPNNRYLIRSAARLLVHVRAPDEAHRLVLRSPRTRDDPWLMAVEIAVADLAAEPPRLTKRARSVIEQGTYSPKHLTELASALGTVELKAGRNRESRRLFRRSLIEPTENSLAQAQWASHHLSGLEVISDVLHQPEAYEARARAELAVGDWTHSAAESWLWYWDQPFSSVPALFGSYGTGVGGDFEQSANFAESGLRSNPDNDVLLNNAAFALLQLNRIVEARQHLDKLNGMSLTGRHLVANLATRGLLAYREGRALEGRELYLRAVDSAAERFPEMQAMAAILLAIEERHLSTPRAEELGRLAIRLATPIDEPGVNLWRKRLIELMESASGAHLAD